jgi:hypothetical protein
LLSAQAVRERAHEMLAAGCAASSRTSRSDLESLGTAAHVVSELTRVSYPDGNVPFHARWRHFVLGGRDLWAERAAQAAWASPAAKARAEFDLAITSVLLDAGAGPSWRYLDPATEQVVARFRRARRRQPADVRGRRLLGRSGRSAARRRRTADAPEIR